MKVVINTRYGGFGLSNEALQRLSLEDNIYSKEFRYDPKLIEVVESMGELASADYCDLKIVDIPDDVQWDICENNGIESIVEKHRIWN
jgi:hypothetical protein